MPQIKKGKYKHFKGTIVEVIGTALHSETMQELVIYLHPDPVKGLGANTMWARPKEMFQETITRDGKEMQRFKFIE